MTDTQSVVDRVEKLKDAYTHRGQLYTNQAGIIEGVYRSLLHFPPDKKTIDVLLLEANDDAAASLRSHLFNVLNDLTWRGEGQIRFQRRNELRQGERNNYDLYFFGPTIKWENQIVDSGTIEEAIKDNVPTGKKESRLVFFYQLEKPFIQSTSLEECFPVNILIVSAEQYPEYRGYIAGYLRGVTIGNVIKRPEFEKLANRPAFNIMGTPSKEDLLKNPSKYPAEMAFINIMCLQKLLLDELQIPLIQLYMEANPTTFVRATVNEHQAYVMTKGEPHPQMIGDIDHGLDSKRYRELEDYCRDVRSIVEKLEKTSHYGLPYFHFLRPDTSLLATWGDSLALPKPRTGKNPITPTDVENYYINYAYSLVYHFLSGENLYRLVSEKARLQNGLNLQYERKLIDTTGITTEFRTKTPYLTAVPIVFAGPSASGKSITVSQLNGRTIKLDKGSMELVATEKYITKYDIDTVSRDVLMGLRGQTINILTPAEFESFWNIGKFLIRYTHFGQNYAVPSNITDLIQEGKSPMVILNQDGVNKSKQHIFFSNAIYFLLYCNKSDYERRLSERVNNDENETKERICAWEHQMIQYEHDIEGYDVVLETSPHVLLDDDLIIKSEENQAVQRVIEAFQYGIRKDTHHTHIDNLLGRHFKTSMEQLSSNCRKRGGRKVPIDNIDELIRIYAEMKNIGIADLKHQIPRYISAVINWHGAYEIMLAKPKNYDEHAKQHLISLLSMLFGTPSEKVEHVVFKETSSFSYCRAVSGGFLIDHVASFGFWDKFIPEPMAPVRNLAFSIANVDSKLLVGTDVNSCDLYVMTNPEIRAYRCSLFGRTEQSDRTAGRM